MEHIKAIVQNVIPDGKHGPYVVATGEGIGNSITFSLAPAVWQEETEPEPGMIIHLSEIRQKRAGWRANKARFWKLTDENSERTVVSNEHFRFLYPKSRQFPFDEVCENIVRSLEKRNWTVPGIKVEFQEYGSSESKLRYVSKIEGNDFRLYFCRIQGSLGSRFNDIAAVNNLFIKRMSLTVYDDESGPTFYTYVGKDWPRDKVLFVNGAKVNSKLRHEPRMYLVYHGSCVKPKSGEIIYTRRGTRSPYLVNDDDFGREYDARGQEPLYYETHAIMDEFKTTLENDVLNLINQK